ncbi:MAG: hypothetical protein Q8902_02915 [Bacteroidota bacterium]|nr:hypothetical protein [Bacteroidota bacterium]MDP4232570.1 hypothetical protein [Bacteroidota bacterium]MDP4242976.1 hypothetical protein [Bacteroidota bacterium]
MFWTVSSLLFVGLAVLLIIQLPVFKRLVVNELVKTIESSTNGTLVVKTIDGNLLQGFIMRDVTLQLKTGTKYDSVNLIHADELLARYSVVRWLRKDEIGITSLVLVRPTIRLVKFAGDTTWNYSLLTKYVPTAPKAPRKPFTQILDLAGLRIQDGSIFMRDYNFPARPTKVVGAAEARVKEKEIDWSDLDIEGLDFDGRFYAHGSTAQSARVNHLRFTETHSGFFVQHLEFAGYLDSIQARMDHAKITTGHTDIGFSLEVSPPRSLQAGQITSIQHSSIKLAMKGPVISTYELKQFLPSALGFLGGSPGIDLDCSGEFGALKIKRLSLDFKGRGGITIVGDLKNLHHPDSLWMNLALEARNLTNATLDAYVPGLHLPNLSRFGTMTIPRLTFTGEPLNFHTVFDARSTGAGNIAADAIMDFRHSKIQYRAGIRTKAFNFAAIIPKPEYETSISADGTLAGTGTNWKTLATTLGLKATEPSIVAKRQIQTFDLAGSMKLGHVKIDRLIATLAGGPEVNVRAASADLLSPTLPFAFDGTVNDLKLTDVLSGKQGNPARLSFDATVVGTAMNLEDATGTFKGKLFDLEYRGRPLNDVTIDAKLAPLRAGDNNLELSSDIANITIQHRFGLADLMHTLPEHVNALMIAIKDRDFPESGVHTPLQNICSDSIDFDYDIRIKDLRPLADFLPETFLLAEGDLNGTVAGCPKGDLSFTMRGDSIGFIMRSRPGSGDSPLAAADTSVGLAFDNLIRGITHDSTSKTDTARHTPLSLPQFGEGTPRIHVTPTSFRLEAENLSIDPKLVLDHLSAKLAFASDSVIRLGSALFFKPMVDLEYKNQVLDFNFASVYNDAIGLHVAGSAKFPNHAFDFALDTISAVYFNSAQMDREYRWMNEGVSHVLVDQSGTVTIDTLRLVHPLRHFDNEYHTFALRVNVGGTLHHDSVDAWARVPGSGFNLEDLDRVLPGARSAAFVNYGGEVRDLAVDLHGTLERPEIAARLRIDSMTYGPAEYQITFDSNYLDLTYRNQILQGTIDMHVARIQTPNGVQSFGIDSTSALTARIQSIPMLFALKHGPTFVADSLASLKLPVSARIDASHFPVDVATPFLPVFTAMTGTADLHFSATGTRENIVYGGSATITNGEILLGVNNMWYRVDGPLSFANNSLRLNNIALRNIDADDPDGRATLNGHFDFSGFTITNFDIAARSDRLMVLSDDSRQSIKAIYGPVTISTGGQDLHFHNTFKAPSLNGTVNILSAHLTLPQAPNAPQAISSEGIVYRTLPNDSAIVVGRDTVIAPSARENLRRAVSSASVRMTRQDDSLFSNQMKNIYLNDDGSMPSMDTVNAAESNSALGPSFADRLRMDLRVAIQGDATVFMPFNGLFGLIGAQMNAGLKSDGVITFERGDELGMIDVNGVLELTPNSTFRFYQTFNIASGSLQFTSDFTNPQLNIIADYVGPHHDPKGENQAKIELAVTGTKAQPHLDAAIYTDASGSFELRPESTSQTAVEDALYFLASGGYFKNEMTPDASRNVLANASSSLGTQLLSDMLSNSLGSTSSEFALRSASLRYGPNAGVELTAAIYKITLHYNLNTTQNSSDYIIDLPLSGYTTNELMRSLLIELQYHQNSTTMTAGSLIQQPLVLTKLVWTPPFLRF